MTVLKRSVSWHPAGDHSPVVAFVAFGYCLGGYRPKSVPHVLTIIFSCCGLTGGYLNSLGACAKPRFSLVHVFLQTSCICNHQESHIPFRLACILLCTCPMFGLLESEVVLCTVATSCTYGCDSHFAYEVMLSPHQGRTSAVRIGSALSWALQIAHLLTAFSTVTASYSGLACAISLLVCCVRCPACGTHMSNTYISNSIGHI